MTEKSFDGKTFLKNITQHPGVYRMYNEDDVVIYVGKARNLKKRLSSYFRKHLPDVKTQQLVANIHHIDVTITTSENEALILENIYIKKYRPRYNVIYRDDKGYPYIYLSDDKNFPQLTLYRGSRKKKGTYYGPYPNVRAARQSLYLLQKLFKLRSCDDTFFKNRRRPCLQYQIKRCSAPCVNYIEKKAYKEQLAHANLFLAGKSFSIVKTLIEQMEQLASNKAYEKAAALRDQIALLRDVQAQNYVVAKEKSADVISLARCHGVVALQVLFIRDGQLMGNRVYYPKTDTYCDDEEILSAFISQHYLSQQTPVPQKIIVNCELSHKNWMENALKEMTQKTTKLITHPRGEQVQWMTLSQRNAEQSIKNHLADKANQTQRLESLQHFLKLHDPIERMECFDISHTLGEATVASCVVFDKEGPHKEDYRRYNIKDITPGDDYGALYQALTRRYKAIQSHNKSLPDVVIIDGGKGQLHQAEKVFAELQMAGVTLMSVAKGPGRKAGLETLFVTHADKEGFQLDSTSPALHLIQHIRDEAHRFAITAHRQQRGKKRTQSVLESIPGVGAKRRKALLQYFGGLQEIKKNSASELAKVPGISKVLAEIIYHALHDR
ncbi:MAG: excinuclease ABC subunit UvrC [Gammaproteobacteria bacterium]